MVRSAKTADAHKRDLIEDLKQNQAGASVRVSADYLDYIAADRDYAAELAASGSLAWVVHAEKGGDGGLTDAERATLDSADNLTLVTVSGSVLLLPDEGSGQDSSSDRHRSIDAGLTAHRRSGCVGSWAWPWSGRREVTYPPIKYVRESRAPGSRRSDAPWYRSDCG